MRAPPHRACSTMCLDTNALAFVAEEVLEPSLDIELDAQMESAHEAARADVPRLAKLAAATLVEADLGRSLGFLQAGQCCGRVAHAGRF